MNYVVDLEKGWVVHQDDDYFSAERYIINSAPYVNKYALLIVESAKRRDEVVKLFKEYKRLGYSNYNACMEVRRDIRKGYC